MKNELIEFSALIALQMKSNLTTTQGAAAIDRNTHALILQDASLLVLNNLETLACSKHRISVLYRQVKKVQDFCCRSLTAIYKISENPAIENELLENNKVCLMLLLQQLKTNYELGFNPGAVAPMYWKLSTVEQLARNENLMLAGLKKQNITLGLRELLLTAFKQELIFQLYSFQQLDYLLFCQQVVINFCKKIPNEQAEVLLLSQLVYYNFNDLDLLAYVKQLIEAHLLTSLHDKAQYQKLCAIEKDLFCVPHQDEFALYNNRLSAQSQLLAYVTAGIVYFHRKADFDFPKQTVLQPNLPTEAYRIKINLSADALAYLIRLLIENGVIAGDPKSKVLLFFAAHFQTPGIGDELLSVKSLGTKYKQVVQRTAVQVRNTLKRLLKEIDAEFVA